MGNTESSRRAGAGTLNTYSLTRERRLNIHSHEEDFDLVTQDCHEPARGVRASRNHAVPVRGYFLGFSHLQELFDIPSVF
jgi:hypothetical protein